MFSLGSEVTRFIDAESLYMFRSTYISYFRQGKSIYLVQVLKRNFLPSCKLCAYRACVLKGHQMSIRYESCFSLHRFSCSFFNLGKTNFFV